MSACLLSTTMKVSERPLTSLVCRWINPTCRRNSPSMMPAGQTVELGRPDVMMRALQGTQHTNVKSDNQRKSRPFARHCWSLLGANLDCQAPAPWHLASTERSVLEQFSLERVLSFRLLFGGCLADIAASQTPLRVSETMHMLRWSNPHT